MTCSPVPPRPHARDIGPLMPDVTHQRRAYNTLHAQSPTMREVDNRTPINLHSHPTAVAEPAATRATAATTTAAAAAAAAAKEQEEEAEEEY